MILSIFNAMGFNAELFIDFMFILLVCSVLFIIFLTTSFKGIWWPILRTKFKKENIAFVDLGGLETPVINFPRGSNELKFEHKGNQYSWPIPDGIEQLLPNNTRYILASRAAGAAFNTNILAMGVTDVRRLLSPKAQAITIDDRSKQIADKLTKDINKPAVMAAGVAILVIVGIFGYLIFMKAAEYDLCRETIGNLQQIVTTTTLPKLPPLD